MRKIALALLVGVLALSAGLYLLVWRPLFILPDALPRAEQALATPDLLLLAGVNAKQADFLERWFMDLPAVAPESAPPAPGERGLLDHLRGARVDPRRDLDYVLYALYPSQEAGLRQAVALIGRFDPAAIGAYLTGELHARPITADGRTSYEVTLTDASSCKPAATWRVTAEPGWILLADPASYAGLASRFGDRPQGENGETRWWHELALTDVAGISVRKPDRLETSASIPLVGPAADAMAPNVEAFQRAYLGLGISAVPPQGRLRLVLDARDANRATEQIKTWQHAVNESRARWATTLPTMARLYDGLSIRTEGARSTVDVTVNWGTIARLQDVANELIGQVFGGFGVQADPQPTSSDAEQIETNPPKLEPVASIAALGPYDPAVQFAEKVDVNAGPFGARLDMIRLGSKPEDGLELAVSAFANAIPNISGDPARAKLIIDRVTAADGQELLKREDCGRDRNSKPADFTSSLPPRLSASKIARLIAGADARALQRIEGRIALRLPTKTEAVTVADPKAGVVVERYGARIAIKQIAGSSFSYQITGDRDRVLLLHALNAKGQPLASHMKISGDLLLGAGLAGRTDYSGSISALEIVFVAEEQATEFPFALTNFSLAGEPRPIARDDTAEFQPYGQRTLRAQYATDVPKPGTWKTLPPPEKPLPRVAVTQAGPFEISLNKAQPFFQLSLNMTVRGPDAPGFRRRFNLGELQLTRLTLKDGSVLMPPAAATGSGTARADRSVWSAPLRFMSTPKQGALATSPSFSIDTKAKPQDLQSVEGHLSLRLPTALYTLRLDDLRVGQTVGSGDATVTVTARGRQSLTLETNQDAERVVYVRLLDAQGQPLMFSAPEVTALPDGGARLDLSPLNAPTRAEIVIAREMETEMLPFGLALP
jgi:hypothetical protein